MSRRYDIILSKGGLCSHTPCNVAWLEGDTMTNKLAKKGNKKKVILKVEDIPKNVLIQLKEYCDAEGISCMDIKQGMLNPPFIKLFVMDGDCEVVIQGKEEKGSYVFKHICKNQGDKYPTL